MKKEETSTKKKTVKKKKKGKVAEEQGLVGKAFSWIMNKINHILQFILALIIIVIVGLSYYAVYAGITPTNTNEKLLMTKEYSLYPFVKSWEKSLRKDNQLKEVTMLSKDSVQLHAYYIPAKKQTAHTVILVHGHRMFSLTMMHYAYMYYHDLGFNVFMPDLRTHGKSGGTHIQMGWFDRRDLIEWCKVADRTFSYVTEDGIHHNAEMVLHGESMGAATVMMACGEEDLPHNVVCAIEDCGYTSVWDEFSYITMKDYGLPAFPIMNLASQFCKWQFGWSFKEASSISQIRNVGDLPILFIHGEEDTYVPTEMVHELYKAKPKNKAIWLSPGSMHAMSFHDHKEEYTKQVKAFINSYMYRK